jgi:hypothetical protein
MSDVDLSSFMQSKVETLLQTMDAEAPCYMYNLPPDSNTTSIVGCVYPSSGGVSGDGGKSITMQVRIRSSEESVGKQAIELVYEGLKDVEFLSGEQNAHKIICTAVSTPSYMGLDDAGQPIFVTMFELNSVY